MLSEHLAFVLDTYAPRMGAYGVAVYLLLTRHATPTGQAWPSLSYMARHLSLSVKSISRTLAALGELGLLTKTLTAHDLAGGQRNVYTLTLVAGFPQPEMDGETRDVDSETIACESIGMVHESIDVDCETTHEDYESIYMVPESVGMDCESSHAHIRNLEEKTWEEEKRQEQGKDPHAVLLPSPDPNDPGIPNFLVRQPQRRRTMAQKGYSADFQTFYQAYPRKVAVDIAWKAWQERDGDTHAEAIMTSLASHIAHAWQRHLTRHEEQYIPHPSTFLRGGYWKETLAAPRDPVDDWINELEQEASHDH